MTLLPTKNQRIHLEQQIDMLAKYLLGEFDGPIKDESAIEMAMRLLNEYKFRDGVVGKWPNGEEITSLM